MDALKTSKNVRVLFVERSYAPESLRRMGHAPTIPVPAASPEVVDPEEDTLVADVRRKGDDEPPPTLPSGAPPRE